ncbi:MAG TPA: hypothetical protein VJ859_07330 [Allosphingosinicella sp.]|nr:hypothetical protein [Allosphingosinicella sp.]
MSVKTLRRIGLAVLCGLLATFCVPAAAAVEVAFYSKEFGATFPHAFITVKGSVDTSGEKVDASYGFTAKSISPGLLMHAVPGEIVPSSAAYIAHSNRHFAMTLNDAEYAALLATVDKWRTHAQPSYDLNRRNCVFFVADVAATLGLKAETPKALMKKPRSYLQSLVAANRTLLAGRGARIDD